MKLNSIRVVLVATSHPGNIGAAARAMKTMGLEHLYLVTPKSFPDQKAVEMAAGAEDILQNAKIVTSLAEALKDCQLVFGTSARPREISLPGLTPREMATLLHQSQPENTRVALVFGREHAGLTNQELLNCHYHVNIPSNPDYSSLNLAQAVQILAYELRMGFLNPQPVVETVEDSLATVDEVEKFHAHFQEVLIAIDFLKTDNPGRLTQRLRRLFNRIQLETMEINILRGILAHFEKNLSQASEFNKGV